MMRGLIVSDIDGTLVPDGQSEGALDPEYYEVIERLIKKGYVFAACSGRQYLSIYKTFRPIADDIYFICEGGGMVSDGKRNILSSSILAPDTVNEIIRDAKKIPQLDIMIAGIKKAYCRSRDSEMYRWMYDDYGFDIEAIGDLEKGVDDDVCKVSLYHHHAAEQLTSEWFRPKWETRVKTVLAGIQWLDMISFSSGKGNAVTFLQKHLNIGKSETIVFGDNQNDIEMFGAAGLSYAVANAREETKKAADRVCGSMREDGVLAVLKELLVNE
ncbi:MAG: HAD family hydrolase [Eubacterium sp.]|nr:HAD family hydrolase [Eubacterium sp.]